MKNRTRSEFSKRDIHLDVNLSRLNGRRAAFGLDVFEVNQNMELLDLMDRQTKEVEALLKKKYEQAKPVQLLMSIPGIGFLSAVTLFAEICDIRRFSTRISWLTMLDWCLVFISRVSICGWEKRPKEMLG